MRTFLAPGLATLAGLFLAAPAGAHVTVVPPFAAAGVEVRLVLDVPNERRTEAMTSLRITAPPGMTLRAGERLGAWRATVSGDEVRWLGGSLPPRQTARFALVAVAPTAAAPSPCRPYRATRTGAPCPGAST